MPRNTPFEETGTSAEESGSEDNRVKAIRALAHPLRLRILDLIQDRGPMTASQVSELVGESPTNCAFHLRTLGRYGYLEEAGGGKGRERPWRHKAHELAIDDTVTDRESVAGFRAAAEVRQRARRAEWDARSAHAPQEWQHADFDLEISARLTPAELRAARHAIQEAVMRIVNKRDQADPAAALVVITASGFPVGSLAGEGS